MAMIRSFVRDVIESVVRCLVVVVFTLDTSTQYT